MKTLRLWLGLKGGRLSIGTNRLSTVVTLPHDVAE